MQSHWGGLRRLGHRGIRKRNLVRLLKPPVEDKLMTGQEGAKVGELNSAASTSSEDSPTLFSQEMKGPFSQGHPMVKKQPASQQHHPDTQPEAAVEQGRQAAQQQDHGDHEEAPKHCTAHDHSQDADRYSKTRHVHSQ
jgi:ABC-type uncharacterized transport system involved in gliding motility auxiliary subunit